MSAATYRIALAVIILAACAFLIGAHNPAHSDADDPAETCETVMAGTQPCDLPSGRCAAAMEICRIPGRLSRLCVTTLTDATGPHRECTPYQKD